MKTIPTAIRVFGATIPVPFQAPSRESEEGFLDGVEETPGESGFESRGDLSANVRNGGNMQAGRRG